MGSLFSPPLASPEDDKSPNSWGLIFLIADGELYTATVSDFSGSDPLIYKEPLRTVQFDSKHLNCESF